MWDCIGCGCKAIAHDLAFCPHCFKERDDMPKITTAGGPTSALAEPGDPGYIDPEDADAAERAEQADAERNEAERTNDEAGLPRPVETASAPQKAEPKPAPAKAPKPAGS